MASLVSRGFRRSIRRAFLALACGVAFCLPAAAEPALWVVKDRDSTIYLFGTVHMLKPETRWLSPRAQNAIDRSDQLWLELPITTLAEVRDAMAPLVKRFGMASEALSSRLSAEDRQKLADATRRAGLPPNTFDAFQPWFASMGIATSAMTRAGYSTETGVEAQLRTRAQAHGLSVHGFETPEDQIGIFAGLSEEDQLRYLCAALATYQSAPKNYRSLVDVWLRGGTAEMEDALVGGMRTVEPELYDKLFTRRNAAWARQIEQLLEGSGTVFVAVGAAHFLGPESLQAQLAHREIAVTRIQ